MEALERYLQKKDGVIEYKPSNEVIDRVLHVTKGELAYQEQMMRLMKDMAGFTDAKQTEREKVSSKKKKMSSWSIWINLKKQSLDNGFSEESSVCVWHD